MHESLPVRSSGAREDVHPLFPRIIDPVSYGIPDARNILPFVDKLRKFILEDERGVCHRQSAVLIIPLWIGDEDDAVATIVRRPGLPAPFGSYEVDCTEIR